MARKARARAEQAAEFEGPKNAARRRLGRKPILDDEDREVLRRRVTEAPATSTAELIALLAAERGQKVCAATVSKAMRSMGFRKLAPRKAPSIPAPQTPPRYTEEHRREPSAEKYPSSMTDAEWEVIEPVLQETRDPRGRKPQHEPRTMMDAVFYLIRTGCQWRALPKDFPPWTAVWSLFRRLRDTGALERLYDALFALWRTSAERSTQPTAGIIDSQTVKTTEKGGPAATTPGRRRKGARGTWSSM